MICWPPFRPIWSISCAAASQRKRKSVTPPPGEMAEDLTAVANRILTQVSGLTEQTSTLTLVSLPSVEMPPLQPHTTDTVIIAAGDRQNAASVSAARA